MDTKVVTINTVTVSVECKTEKEAVKQINNYVGKGYELMSVDKREHKFFCLSFLSYFEVEFKRVHTNVKIKPYKK